MSSAYIITKQVCSVVLESCNAGKKNSDICIVGITVLAFQNAFQANLISLTDSYKVTVHVPL
ncbi:MAG: hypothetical protein ACD_75C01393G0002 [uncultured bacterium]|nr:MAG: hypothetical protein ACD_75C01393G0002 [uncultured bacterium]